MNIPVPVPVPTQANANSHGSPGAAAAPPTVLSAKAREILGSIADAGLRRDVETAVIGALEAIAALNRVHLPQDHFEENDAQKGDDRHLDLAPYVLAALASINRLLGHVGSAFPAPAVVESAGGDDFDLEFDLVDGPTGEGKSLAVDKAKDMQKSPREQAGETLHAMGSMLKSRVSTFGQRLRHATVQSDSWPLLAELDDNLSSLKKAVQGLLFGVLGVFNDNVRREEILPAYRSGVSDAVELRAAITEVGYHIARSNAVIANATQEQLVPLVVAVADRLTRFAARPEYRSMRAEDKKAVIDFRRQLHALRYAKNGVPSAPLKHAVEGFSKFLDAMQAINHREVLVLHDRQRLMEAGQRLVACESGVADDMVMARNELREVVKQLATVMGRHPDLDEALRRFDPMVVTDAGMLAELVRWRQLCEVALGVVG